MIPLKLRLQVLMFLLLLDGLFGIFLFFICLTLDRARATNNNSKLEEGRC
jgi:hypothetical protein